MKQFKGRVITPGEVTAEAVVTTEGFNTLASFQNALQFGDKEVKCGDQNNKDLYGKSLLHQDCQLQALSNRQPKRQRELHLQLQVSQWGLRRAYKRGSS